MTPKTSEPDSLVLAAGAVVWRADDGDSEVEVALVHRPRYDDWSVPKGKVDPGEHLLATAVREVAEETGQQVVLGRFLGAAAYVALGRPKRVHYWAARALGGAFLPHEEVDALEWLPVAAARDRVHRDSDRAVLDAFADGPRDTRAVIVLRHAKAVARKAWAGAELERPLAPDGRNQAGRLPALLGAWSPSRVLSSPARRCAETVEPFLTGAPAELEPALTEQTHEIDPTAAPAVLARVLEDGASAVVCSHRPVLPGLIDTLRAVADIDVDLRLRKRPLRPAEMVVAHVEQRRVVAVERHRP